MKPGPIISVWVICSFIQAFGNVELVIFSEDAFLNPGTNVTLVCVGFSTQNYNVTWQQDGRMIDSSMFQIYEDSIQRGGRLYKYSIIQICDVQLAIEGDYQCFVDSEQDSVNSTVIITVNDTLPTTEVPTEATTEVTTQKYSTTEPPEHTMFTSVPENSSLDFAPNKGANIALIGGISGGIMALIIVGVIVTVVVIVIILKRSKTTEVQNMKKF